jgi:hypothetical protein
MKYYRRLLRAISTCILFDSGYIYYFNLPVHVDRYAAEYEFLNRSSI